MAAGCLVNERGDVLIAQRPAGKIAAGKWEFPGGKIEPGETARHALERELREELGIQIEEARPLIRVRHAYSDRIVILDTWRVSRWRGEMHPHDAQQLAWSSPQALIRHDLLAADQPIVDALCLPADYAFTPPDATGARILRCLPSLPAHALVRLRLPGLSDPDYRRVARDVIAEAHARRLQVVLDRDPADAVACGADGWHASSRALRQAADLPRALRWRFASVHDAGELAMARERGFHAAVLGPVRATASHPEADPLGWERFEALAGEAGMPVYAIGGLGPRDCDQAFAHYAQGIAGIRAYWP